MSESQRTVALQCANRVRTARAKIKRELKDLPRCEALGVVADILERPPECCLGATPFELLMSVRFMGRHYTLSRLRGAGVQERRQVRELTERQRFALAGLLREGEGTRVAA